MKRVKVVILDQNLIAKKAYQATMTNFYFKRLQFALKCA